MPSRADASAPGADAGTSTFGVPSSGRAASAWATAANPKAQRGPSVVSAQPPATGPAISTTRATASRALTW